MNELTDENELYELVYNNSNGHELEKRLKNLSNVEEKLFYFYQRDDQCLNLLILAALHGKEEIVRTIFKYSLNSRTLIDLRGCVYRNDGILTKNATALWCACDRGHYTVARIIIDEGHADIDCGPRHTILIDAIILGRLDTVRFFIENNYVDLTSKRENENYKFNSLITAVTYGHAPIVAYLLEKGSKCDIMLPPSNNTPLGYAAIRGFFDIVRLLCTAGGNPSLKNKYGQTPLMLAAKHENMDIVEYLLYQNNIEISIKQLELVACSFIVPTNKNHTIQQPQFEKMVSLMNRIFEIRQINNLSKTVAQPIAAYGFYQECQTIEEFTQIRQNSERLYFEALMIRERILVPEKDEGLFKALLVIGDRLVERKQFDLCLHLWEHTFYLYQSMDLETGLHRFVWLFCKMISANIQICPQRFVKICRLTFEPSQQKPKDDYIKNSLCFLALAVKILERSTLTKQERQLIYQWITDLCLQKRITSCGQTLLHLCVDEQTYYDINYRPNDIKPILIFPNLAVAQLLITRYSQSIDINAVEPTYGNTALHVSSRNTIMDSLAIVQFLINSGAHIDCMNVNNQTPCDIAPSNFVRTLLRTKQSPLRLKCFCARFILAKDLPYELIWPKETEINSFLFLHGAVAKLNEHRSD